MNGARELGDFAPPRSGRETTGDVRDDDGRPEIPTALNLRPDDVPTKLTDREQWVCWRTECRDCGKRLDPSSKECPECDGKASKKPIKPYDERDGARENIDEDHDEHGDPEKNHDYAGSTWRHTWRLFDDAVAYHDSDDTDTDGVGFVVHEGDMFAGLDLDDCRNPDTGDLETWAAEVVDDVPTYGEVSPSGTGLHLLGVGVKPDGNNRGDVDDAEGHIEMYDSGRYLTVTGHHVDGTPEDIRQVNDELSDVYEEHVADDEPTGDDADERTDQTPPASTPSEATAEPDPNDLSDDEVIELMMNDGYAADLWEGRWKKHRHRWDTSEEQGPSEADLALCNKLAFYSGGDRQQMARLFRRSGLSRPKLDRDDYVHQTINTALKGRTDYYTPPVPDELADKLDDDATADGGRNEISGPTVKRTYLAVRRNGGSSSTSEVVDNPMFDRKETQGREALTWLEAHGFIDWTRDGNDSIWTLADDTPT